MTQFGQVMKIHTLPNISFLVILQKLPTSSMHSGYPFGENLVMDALQQDFPDLQSITQHFPMHLAISIDMMNPDLWIAAIKKQKAGSARGIAVYNLEPEPALPNMGRSCNFTDCQSACSLWGYWTFAFSGCQ